MKKPLLLLLACLLPAFVVQAQYIRCGTDAYQAALDASDPAQHALREAANLIYLKQAERDPTLRKQLVVTIPVVFHVLYANATQNIPDIRIIEQVDVLNRDYGRTNLDAINTRAPFLPVAANTQIQFCLAQRTPQNAATTGIVRISCPSFPNNPNTVSPEWDHTQYLNIYVGDLGGGLLGYSNLPPGSPGSDHVVILYSSVGGPNHPGTANPYHLGRTATHEIGHWLNLYHTFQNGCSGTTANNCTTGGDQVCDTPPVANSNFGCPTNNPNSCTETAPFPPPYTSNMVDMYENYMDYTDDGCMNIFTLGQSTRMNDAIIAMRSALFTSQGCVPVGISEILDPTYLIISPNPSSGLFLLNFNFPTPTDVAVLVTDLSGRLVIQRNFSAAGTGSESIDLSAFAGGMYLFRAETAKGTMVKNLVVAR